MIRKFALTLGISAMALGLTFTGASADGHDTSIVIHKADCYAGVGSAIFEECHHHPIEDVDFGIGIESGEIDIDATDADGQVGWEWYGGGDVVLVEQPQPEGYVGVYVYCRDLVSDEVLYDGSVAADEDGYFILDLETEAGMEIVCDWYNIAADGSHEPTTGPAMPNTGAGVMAGGTAPFAAMVATGLLALAGAAALRRRAA